MWKDESRRDRKVGREDCEKRKREGKVQKRKEVEQQHEGVNDDSIYCTGNSVTRLTEKEGKERRLRGEAKRRL